MAESSSKRSKSMATQDNIDRISSLPDNLLHHILSFLPIKEAIRTSLLLSKRWAPLALSMPTLDLDDSDFPSSHNSFVQFVDVLLFLFGSKPITTFRLNCSSSLYKVPPIRIKLWINAVISRKIEHLKLSFGYCYGRHNVLPTSVFHSSTIIVLKLNRVVVNAKPLVVNLPSLKVLHLVDVKFSCLESANNFFSGCPFLEDLVLQSKIVFQEGLIAAEIGVFQHLVSAKVSSCYISVLASLSNAKFLQFDGGMIMWHDWLPNVQASPTFYNLTELELSHMFINDISNFVECLERFPKLEILNIFELVPTLVLGRELMNAMLDVPQCVASSLKKFCVGKYKGTESEFELAKFIMKNANELMTISIICCSDVEANSKLQMLRRLSSCTRGSVNCRLLYEIPEM